MRGGAILEESYDARKALTGSVKGGVASGSQNPRIIPDFLASRRPTRVVLLRLHVSCSVPGPVAGCLSPVARFPFPVAGLTAYAAEVRAQRLC